MRYGRSASCHRPDDPQRLAAIATASGSEASGSSWERSSSQAKKRMNGRRRIVVGSRTVPRNIG